MSVLKLDHNACCNVTDAMAVESRVLGPGTEAEELTSSYCSRAEPCESHKEAQIKSFYVNIIRGWHWSSVHPGRTADVAFPKCTFALRNCGQSFLGTGGLTVEAFVSSSQGEQK